MSGADFESVFHMFAECGQIRSIRLIPHKAYSFVEFGTEKQAETAKTKRNEKTEKLFLAFVDGIPDDGQNPWKNSVFPPGLNIVPDFVTEKEEEQILNSMDWQIKGHLIISFLWQ